MKLTIECKDKKYSAIISHFINNLSSKFKKHNFSIKYIIETTLFDIFHWFSPPKITKTIIEINTKLNK